jgi:alkylation response protein AidB-like acyl-CoA dehydrogenase
MDFRFTPEEEAFRREVRAFLDAELPMDWEEQFGTESESDAAWKFSKSFCKKMAARGWVGIAWPKEYGGQGRSHMEQLIFNEELSHRRAPIRPIYMSTDRVGPSIIIYGTEEQKKRFLPRMTAAHCVFCQGFSEPGSGSDLASLQTRAVAEGDFFVVTGQKIYELRPPRRLLHIGHAYRPERPQTPGHHLLPDGHAATGHNGAPDGRHAGRPVVRRVVSGGRARIPA